MNGTEGKEEAGRDPRPHILVVEGKDLYARESCRDLDRSAGEFRITCAGTVSAAREITESDPPDLIIADWLLPDGRGIDVLPRRAGKVTAPLIVMTRQADARLAVQVLKSGAIDYLVKTDLTPETLPRIAERALREWENIRERKRAEELARESEQRIADIIGFLPDATMAIDTAGKVIVWNHAMEELTGVPAAEMIGKGDYEYSLPFYGTRRPILVDLILADNPAMEKNYFFIRRDGNRLTTETYLPSFNGGKGAYLWGMAAPLFDAGGNRSGAIEAIRDITDRKQMELALRENESRYRFLVDNIRDIVWQSTPDLTFTYVSPAAERLTGYAVSELVGRSLFTLLTDRSVTGIRERLADRLRENLERGDVSATVFLIEMRRKDGTPLRFEVSSAPVFTPEGKFTGFSGVARDITERLAAEEALKESEARFRDLFNNMSSGVVIYEAADNGEDFIVRDINHAVETIEQVKREEIVGRRLRTVFPGVEALGLLAVFRRVWQSGTPEHQTASLYRDDRISGWRENFVYRLASGEIVTIYDDVTQRQLAAEALRESEEKFRNVVENVPDLIVVHDGTKILFVNGAGPAVTGYSEEEILGQPLSRFIAPESLARVGSAIRERMEGGSPGPYEADIVKKDGTAMTVMIRGSRIVYDGVPASLNILTDITERKRAENEIRQNGIFLTTLIDTISSPIFYKDRNGVYTGSNRAFGEFVGLPRETLVGKTVYDLWPKDLADVYHAKDQELLDNPGTQTYEGQLRHADGSLHDVVFNKATLTGPGGTVEGLVGVILDITGRKKMESALRKSEVRFRSLIQNSSDIIRVINADRKIVFDSPSSHRILGYPPDSLLGKDPVDYVHPDDRERVTADFAGVLARTNPGTPSEFRIRRSDGSYLYVESVAMNLLDVPEVHGIVVTTRPIHERKLAEISLRESEEKFRRIFNSANDGILIVDISTSGLPGRIRDVNAVQCARLGWTKEEIRAMKLFEIITPESNAQVPAFMTTLLAKGEAVFEPVFRTKDGGMLETEMSSHVIRFRDKDLLIGIARDITQRKKEEQALRLANQKLQLMNIVAWHDIQNKITGLRGYVVLSRDLVKEERAQQFLKKEEEILKTIHDYIQYTKEYQEMGSRPMEWVDIPGTIASVLAITEKGDLAVSVELGSLFLYCDPAIERVFSHLVGNTIAHGKKATRIRIRSEESPSGMTLIYTDDGVGIEADMKQSIFVRDVAKGSGFSLYFIHDILELSGMSIRETGVPGEGVRFEIAIPRGIFRTGNKA